MVFTKVDSRSVERYYNVPWFRDQESRRLDRPGIKEGRR